LGKRKAGPADPHPTESEPVTRLAAGFTIVPALIRQFGVDSAPVLAAAGLEPGALDDPSNRIAHAGALLLHGKNSGADLAQVLAMHRRTLNRRLHAEGTTFQQVLDRVRFAVPKELIEDSRVALHDIAAALGYAGLAPFMRAFRRWTGTTPGAWRQSALAGTGDRRPRPPPRPFDRQLSSLNTGSLPARP
jgi:AraC-like DNA-binding protein